MSASAERGPLALRLAEPGAPRVMCWLVSSSVGSDGIPEDVLIESYPLPVDDAGDLAAVPRMCITPVARHLTVTGVIYTVWSVAGLGFTEQEAAEAHDAAVAEVRRRIEAGEQR